MIYEFFHTGPFIWYISIHQVKYLDKPIKCLEMRAKVKSVRKKKSKFNFVVDYPTWVSIKRYLTGKLTLACQNWIYCLHLNKNVQKPSKTKRSMTKLYFDFLMAQSIFGGQNRKPKR